MRPASQPPQPGARQARDVMAFGQEIGRVLSDGRIVGRAEPFAKVFASSRAVKRAVGPVAWTVLEDIALDARIDDAGRLVAETSVRRIAANLGLNKDTVTRHLGVLRGHGFVFQEEAREVASGRWEPCRYVLDPSACVERFTHTPAEMPRSTPCPKSSDTVAPVSEGTGHGDTGHGDFGHHQRHVDAKEQQHAHAREREAAAAAHGPPAADGEHAASCSGDPAGSAGCAAGDADAGEPTDDADAVGLRQRLLALGVAGHVAADLIARYPRQRLHDAVAVAAAQPARNTAGWIVTALRDGWDLTDRLAEVRNEQARRHRDDDAERQRQQQAEAVRAEEQWTDGWSAAVSAALDEAQLARAIAVVTTPMAGVGRRSVPLACAQLRAWAAVAHQRLPRMPLADALAAALTDGLALPAEPDVGEGLPEPPACRHPPDLAARIAACLQEQTPADGGRAAQAPTTTPSRPPARRVVA